MIYRFLLLLAFILPVVVQAETIPLPHTAKTSVYRTVNINNQQWVYGDTAAQACTNWVSSPGCTNQVSGMNCGWKNAQCNTFGWNPITAVQACPSGYTDAGVDCVAISCPADEGWTLSGSNCTRPDCPAGTEYVNGVCSCPAGKTVVNGVCTTTCPPGYHNAIPDNGQCIKDCVGQQKTGSDGSCICEPKSYTTVTTTVAFNAACVGGCSMSWGAGFANPVDVAKYLAKQIPLSSVGSVAFVRQSGATCEAAPNLINTTLAPLPPDTSGKAADGVTNDPLNKPETNQSPEACAGVGGSYGVINGKSVCLTDKGNSFQKLTVDSDSTVKTNPDGSSSTTTEKKVTVKDPLTGEVKTRSESTTVTKDAAGNITGTGTTAAEGNTRDTDLCSKNPGLQICKGGLNEEATQLKIYAASEKIRDSVSADGFDPAAYITTSDASEEAKRLVFEKYNLVLQEAQKFGSTADPASAKYQEFRDAMGSWWEPISIVGCVPFNSKIGPWSWNFDICPTAAKISEIGSYCMWVLLAFGFFAATTKEAK